MNNQDIDKRNELNLLIKKFNCNIYNKYCSSNFFKSIGIDVPVFIVSSTLSALGGVAGLPNTILLERLRGNLEAILNERSNVIGFNKYLQKLIVEKGFSNHDVIEKANIDKGYFYQIIRGEKHPSRDKVIQIAVALKLNIKETNDLLGKLGFILYGESIRDIIILYGIENKYTLCDINCELQKYEQNLVGINN